MNRELDLVVGKAGLAAHGASPRWEVCIDEALDRDEWSLELDGPHAYLTFPLHNREVVPAALRFLRWGLDRRPNGTGGAAAPEDPRQAAPREELSLGRFGAAEVSLLWDNEGFIRCFLVVAEARSTLRLSFDEEDVRMLLAALEQAEAGLSVSR